MDVSFSFSLVKLRGFNRCVKLAFVLLAAWAPFLLATHPLLAGLLMAMSTGLFFAAHPGFREWPINRPKVHPMRNLKMTLLAIAAPVSACVTESHDPFPAVPAGYNFAYAAPERSDVGLVSDLR